MEWSDGRLDDLSKRVNDGFEKVDRQFERVDRKMDRRFEQLDKKIEVGFEQVNLKFEALHRMLFQAAWALVVGLLGLVGVLVGLIATKF
jgi:hypothetical protein